MKIDKSIKAMPWPEAFHGNAKQHFKLTIQQPVVGGERLLVATFSINWDYERQVWQRHHGKTDFRLICSKKHNTAVILKRGSTTGRRWSLKRVMDDQAGTCPAYCYPEIAERDEAALAKWLKRTSTRNHYMDELEAWVADAIEAETLAERDARGELRDEDVGLCPEELPTGLVDFIRREVLPQDNVLIYKKGNVRALCYRCGENVRAVPGARFKQDQIATCPNCGRRVHAFLEGTDRFKADYVQDIATIQKGTDGKTLFIRQWHLCRDRTARWERVEDHLQEVARYGIRGNRVAKWQKEVKENYYMNTTRYMLKDWERMTSITTVYDGEYFFFLPLWWENILDGTSLEYCTLESYIRFVRATGKDGNTVRFLMDWARYPAIEKLWKAGYRQMVQEKVRGLWKHQQYVVKWERDSIAGAIRFPVRLLKSKKPSEWTMEDVRKLKELWPEVEEGKIAEREIGDAIATGLPLADFEAVLPHTTVHKVAKYIDRQREAEKARRAAEDARQKAAGNRVGAWGPIRVAETYRDYLRDAVALNLDLSDKAVRFPADLDAAHRRTIAQVKYKKDEAIREEFARAVAKLERMAWDKGGLLIRPAHDAGELAAEGAALHHCVAGYSADMAKGQTAIFFIREAAAPDRPFFTLELKGGHVVQCRTAHNKGYEQNEQVKAFVDAWLAKVVNKGKKRTATTAA